MPAFPPSQLFTWKRRSKAAIHRGHLVHYCDRGSQYVRIRYTERLAEAGIEPSAGSVGDSYADALTEKINGLYRADLNHRRGQGIALRPSSS